MNESIFQTIGSELSNIEQQHRVRILFACESGSRAWGFPSRDSDYDVRFVYIRPPEWYLSIDEKRDVIELPIDDMLDINGWDLRKALKLFRKSNPPLMEWLQSDIVYHRKFSFFEKLTRLSSEVFSPLSCMHHYLSMARGNFREYLQGDSVKIKKYFYVLRPVLAAKWIESHGSMPPILFPQLLSALVPTGELRTSIDRLLERKMSGEEFDMEPRIEIISQFLEQELRRLAEVAQTVHRNQGEFTARLDELFRETLREVYGAGQPD